ncbi:MAG TPA: hypothetical protein VGC87_19240 [Pyrinomonadaceae bacterium]|jgi:hypothetical protein
MPYNKARKAAQTAAAILKAAEHDATVASKAAALIRHKETIFNAAAEAMETLECDIKETLPALHDVKGERAVEAALKLAEKVHEARSAASRAAMELREVKILREGEGAAEEAQARIKPAKAQEAQAATAHERAGTNGHAANGGGTGHVEETKVVEAEVIEKVTNVLHSAGSVKTAGALSRIAAVLKKAEDAISESAESLRKNAASKKIAGELRAVETTAGDAVEKMQAAAEQLKKFVRETQPELKQPTYDVWKPAWLRISANADKVDDALKDAKAACEQGESAADKAQLQQVEGYKAQTDEIKKKARNLYDSAVVMEKLLGLRKFFLEHDELIYAKLEDCDEDAQKGVNNIDMLFFAQSLPIINGIIHVGSTREDLNTATEWVKENWKGSAAQPRIVLSALLFLYVTKQGVQRFANSTDKNQQLIWRRIDERVGRLL